MLKFGLFTSACAVDGLDPSDHLNQNLIQGHSVTSAITAGAVEVEIDISHGFEGTFNLCAMQDGNFLLAKDSSMINPKFQSIPTLSLS